MLQDTNNYIAFRTGDVKYISKQALLQNRALLREMGPRSRYIRQQEHGIVVDEIPRSAITKIVIGGVEQ